MSTHKREYKQQPTKCIAGCCLIFATYRTILPEEGYKNELFELKNNKNIS